jgi:hypothetical protein
MTNQNDYFLVIVKYYILLYNYVLNLCDDTGTQIEKKEQNQSIILEDSFLIWAHKFFDIFKIKLNLYTCWIWSAKTSRYRWFMTNAGLFQTNPA